jgi:hypothetical protein
MRRTSALADSEEQVNTLLESLPAADSVFERTTFEQCEKVLAETLGETETSDNGNETTRYNNAATTTNTTTTNNNGLEGVSDIESAFDDLLA